MKPAIALALATVLGGWTLACDGDGAANPGEDDVGAGGRSAAGASGSSSMAGTSADPAGAAGHAGSSGILGAAGAGSIGAPTSRSVEPIDFDAVYVVNGGSDSISVIDPEAEAVARVIQLENAPYPHHIALSPDGSRLAVAAPGMDLSGGHAGHGTMPMPGAVLVLDAVTGGTIAGRALPDMNHNAAFSPDGSHLWTSQMNSAKVLVLDALTLETLGEIDVGAGPAEVTFGGGQVFVANGEGDSVSVIDLEQRAVTQTIPVGDRPVGAWQAPNGRAYVDNEAGQSLSVIDVGTLEVPLTYDLGFTPGMAALAPNGELWVTDADAGQIVRFDADTDLRLGTIPVGAGAHGIAFSSDGARGYVTNQAANSVSVIDLGSGEVRATVQVGLRPNGLVWRAR